MACLYIAKFQNLVSNSDLMIKINYINAPILNI
jgi:hypothetical protein